MHIISVKLCKAAIIISYKFTLSGAAGLITELRERKTTKNNNCFIKKSAHN